MDVQRDPEMADHSSSSHCCFCFGSRRSSTWWNRIRPSNHNPWWSRGVRAFKKIREWSEIVAGPKWKTFIRRFNRNRGSGNGRHGKFQYDPLSYALNFDEGNGDNDEYEEDDDYGGVRDFSSRYAAVSGSGKPLVMDASTCSSGVVVVAS